MAGINPSIQAIESDARFIKELDDGGYIDGLYKKSPR